jgi:hypothetical protein
LFPSKPDTVVGVGEGGTGAEEREGGWGGRGKKEIGLNFLATKPSMHPARTRVEYAREDCFQIYVVHVFKLVMAAHSVGARFANNGSLQMEVDLWIILKA